MTFKIVILLLFAINSVISQELLFCSYENNNNTYTCNILILIQNESYNFTQISGTHLSENGDDNVLAITTASGSSAVTIPSIICDKFQNVETLSYISMGLRKINNDSFAGCSNVMSIDLSNNNIIEIPNGIFNSTKNLQKLILDSNQIQNLKPEWFRNLKSLEKLSLTSNMIEELPSRVFSDLTNLEEIFLDSNKLQVIHSESFWMLLKLQVMIFVDNQIDAIDERIVDVTGVKRLIMIGNICFDSFINDNSAEKQEMRTSLKKCFENYKEKFFGKILAVALQGRGGLGKTSTLITPLNSKLIRIN